MNPKAHPSDVLPGVPPQRIPRHIAVIMDGNGRWAGERGLPRIAGHHQGVEAARAALETCWEAGVEVVTLYSFSTDNWKRPAEEVDGLMTLCVEQLRAERAKLVERGARFRHIGMREGLPGPVLAELDRTTEATARCAGPMLCLALNYGSREEITHAARALAARVRTGDLSPEEIDETMIASALWTRGLPDPDLLVRTAGERRLSNYLLWQVSYAELHVSPKRWPDFGREDMLNAIRDYAARERRFGASNVAADAAPAPDGRL